MSSQKQEKKRPCLRCNGRRTETYTTTESDPGTSVALGAAMGIGYFPMTRAVQKTRQCTQCRGTGVQR